MALSDQSRKHVVLFVFFVFFVVPSSAADWPGYRGNAQRTGCVDGKAGPTAPKVLWVYRAQDHFIAAPVPAGERLYISGLAGFNVPTLLCLNTEPKAAQRVAWAKTAPVLKLPVVSSPAVVGDRLVFGDGMHQIDGAALHCIRMGGMPLWTLPLPGKLVHLEGAPAAAGGRVIIGGGSAGVLCVDPDHVTLEGKEMDLNAVQKILDGHWKELLAVYENDRKKDPDFAVPPSEDQLPKPAPKRLWQQGQDRWHVDAPVALIGDRVLAASAYLDKEQAGERALFCLRSENGEILWKAPLRLNPWGGPSVAGEIVVVAGGSIGFDPRAVKGAKGELVALHLADGKEKWRKDVPGAIVSSVVLASGLALATATDGKVRAFDLSSGERRWVYDGGTPFFAPPAVAGDAVYAGDLRGVLHAVRLANGQALWKLDLGTHTEVKAPGMIYGGPVVHGGRLFVATCNLAEGLYPNRPTVVVCIGDK